jgi:hypothetical protein
MPPRIDSNTDILPTWQGFVMILALAEQYSSFPETWFDF